MDEYDLITFDCYGTLIDWEGGISQAFQREASRDYHHLDRAAIIEAYLIEEPAVEAAAYRSYREVLTEAAQRVAARLGWPITPERATFLADSLPNWQPFADTNAALERLARKFQLGILSNTDDDLFAATCRHFTVAFEPIITAQHVQSYKPGHAHFLAARQRCQGKRWLHAAQSYFHDVVPARELGVPVIWVNRKQEGVRAGGSLPTYEVADLKSLADFVDA